MIILDTHIWLWWVHGDTRLPKAFRSFVDAEEANGLGVSVVACWEIAMLEARQRVRLSMPCLDWLRAALTTRGVILLDLSAEIAVDAANLPEDFHRDPADRLLVATARIHQCPLVTLDAKIRGYSHVKLAP